MAKESMKAREVKRAKLVARYAEKRAALKKVIATSEDPAEAYEAARKLQAIPKNANPIRLHNRCKITGRPKGYVRWLHRALSRALRRQAGKPRHTNKAGNYFFTLILSG